MFTVFLLVVLVTTVVFSTSDHRPASNHENRRASKRISEMTWEECCTNPVCRQHYMHYC
uniref:Alpha-conotoxin-like Pu1.6 n=1 Tax=Conus pulicarius TaxID=93154 RepID=CA16_CONPL|nr:RecName: Full=Alpha-conotoxin-like Pu1.6; Flags: Precursor [Conus pulicarius]